MSYAQGHPVTPRRGPSPALVIGLVLGGCLLAFVVIAAILAAIMFPVFAQAREKARQASCLSNTKQIAMGLMMYTQQYDERLPSAGKWGESLYPFIKNNQVYVCPSDTGSVSSYAFNSVLDQKDMADILRPADQPAFHESSLGARNATDQLQSFKPRHRSAGTPMGAIGYADGHVKSVPAAPSARAGIE